MARITKGFLAAAAVGLTFGAASALAAPIVPSPTVGSGGNTFDTFGCSVVISGAASPSTCSAIDVDSPGTVGVGDLQIQANFGAQGAGSTLDALLTYHVHSEAGISAIDLHYNATFLGGGTSTIIEEVFSDAARTQEVGFLAVNCFAGGCTFADRNDPPLEAADIPLTGTFNDLWIRKNIGAATFAEGDGVFFSVIGQTFETTPVPEPTSLAMIGSALLGFGWLARRRRQV